MVHPLLAPALIVLLWEESDPVGTIDSTASFAVLIFVTVVCKGLKKKPRNMVLLCFILLCRFPLFLIVREKGGGVKKKMNEHFYMKGEN